MATPNSLNPVFQAIQLHSTGLVALITTGGEVIDAEIADAVGSPGVDVAVGSIYISTGEGSPGIWVGKSGAWTYLTID